MEREGFPQRGVRHTANDSRSSATGNSGLRAKGSLGVIAGQDAGAIEAVNRLRVCGAHGNIGNSPILHIVDDLQSLLRHGIAENRHKCFSASGAVVGIVRLPYQLVCFRVIHIGLIPDACIGGVDGIAVIVGVDAAGHDNGLDNGQLTVHAEIAVGYAVHKAILIDGLDVRCAPECIGDIGELSGRVLIHFLERFLACKGGD